jgi:hypothetical protein
MSKHTRQRLFDKPGHLVALGVALDEWIFRPLDDAKQERKAERKVARLFDQIATQAGYVKADPAGNDPLDDGIGPWLPGWGYHA